MASVNPKFVNGWISTVQAGSSAIGSSSATGINVATGDGAGLGTIGTNQYIPAMITDAAATTIKEYVWITAISTDALTVVRQAEDSTRFPASTTTIQSGYKIWATAPTSALNWMAFARTAPGPIGYRSNTYITSTVTGTLTAAVTATVGLFRATPIWIPKQVTADRIAVYNNTTDAAGQVRLGIYASDSDGMPAGLILDAGLIATSSPGYENITISQVLPVGLYWIGMSSSHALTFMGATAAQLACVTGPSNPDINMPTNATYTHTYSSALTSSPTWNINTGSSPLVYLRTV